jgi:hypothetical protein
MPIVNYQYTSDAGNLYQVSLPSDFPASLGMVVATGSEPYLDSQITPRTATYVSTSGQIRSTVIGTPRLFGTLPPILNVGGTVFTLSNAIGQQINAFFPANLVSASGPMGPAGANGSAGFLSAVKELYSHNDNFSFNQSTGPNDMGPDWTVPTSGTYLLLATMQTLPSGTATDRYALLISDDTASVYLASAQCCGAGQEAVTLNAIGFATLTAGHVITRRAWGYQVGGGQVHFGAYSVFGQAAPYSSFIAIQLA